LAHPGQKHKTLAENNLKKEGWGTGSSVRAPSKLEALSSNPSVIKKKGEGSLMTCLEVSGFYQNSFHETSIMI
jgi:hypothetical protein